MTSDENQPLKRQRNIDCEDAEDKCANIDDLSDDNLISIFAHLDQLDKLELPQVSKRWQRLCAGPSRLWQDLSFVEGPPEEVALFTQQYRFLRDRSSCLKTLSLHDYLYMEADDAQQLTLTREWMRTMIAVVNTSPVLDTLNISTCTNCLPIRDAALAGLCSNLKILVIHDLEPPPYDFSEYWDAMFSGLEQLQQLRLGIGAEQMLTHGHEYIPLRFPRALLKCRRLQQLHLLFRHSRLGAAFGDLPNAIADAWPDMCGLSLVNCGVTAVPACFPKWPQLVSLAILQSPASLPASTFAAVQPSTLQLPGLSAVASQLTSLSITSCGVPPVLSLCTKLQTLILDQIDPAQSQLQVLNDLAMLTELRISNAGAGLQGELSVLQEACTGLRQLRLHGCRLSALPKSLACAPNLQLLDLRGNRLPSVPDAVNGTMLALQTLDISYNPAFKIGTMNGSSWELQYRLERLLALRDLGMRSRRNPAWDNDEVYWLIRIQRILPLVEWHISSGSGFEATDQERQSPEDCDFDPAIIYAYGHLSESL